MQKTQYMRETAENEMGCGSGDVHRMQLIEPTNGKTSAAIHSQVYGCAVIRL